MKRIAIAVILLTTAAPAWAEIMGPVSDIMAGTPSENRSLLVNPLRDYQIYRYHGIDDPILTPAGDTYEVAPLAQDVSTSYLLSDEGVTFDGIGESAGLNTANQPSTFSAIETYQPAAGPNGGDLIQVEVGSMDDTGALTAWVASGMTGPGGETLIAWRLDAGIVPGTDSVDAIDPGYPFTVLTAEMEAFDLSGASFGTFSMTADLSDGNVLSGAGVFGLPNNADIAGYSLGSIRLSWEIEGVPEPATAVLLGLAGLALLRFRRS